MTRSPKKSKPEGSCARIRSVT